jgi:hypothetical protein
MLIPSSVRVLQALYYSTAQMEAAIGPVFNVDRQRKKLQNPNSKHQGRSNIQYPTPNKLQTLISRQFVARWHFGALNLEVSLELGPWNLEFSHCPVEPRRGRTNLDQDSTEAAD